MDGAAPAGTRVAAAADPAVRCASRSRAASVTRREKSPSVRPSDQAPGPGASVLDSAAAHCAPPPFDVVDTIMRAHSPASPGRTPGPYGRRAASGLGVAVVAPWAVACAAPGRRGAAPFAQASRARVSGTPGRTRTRAHGVRGGCDGRGRGQTDVLPATSRLVCPTAPGPARLQPTGGRAGGGAGCGWHVRCMPLPACRAECRAGAVV